MKTAIGWIPVVVALSLWSFGCYSIEQIRKGHEEIKVAVEYSPVPDWNLDWVTVEGGILNRPELDRDWYNCETSMADGTISPRCPIRVPSFQMTRSEITVGQYAACVRDGGCDKRRCEFNFQEKNYGMVICNWRAEGREDYPMAGVSWDEAVEFCKWAGGSLPSEAQWDQAVTGGEGRPFPWGNEAPDCSRATVGDNLVCNDVEHPWGVEKSCRAKTGCGGGKGTRPVCSRPSGNSKQGICELGGNAYEFLEDTFCLQNNGCEGEQPPRDGSAWLPTSKSGYVGSNRRVIRGYDWEAVPKPWARFKDRFGIARDRPMPFVGIRCVRPIPPTSEMPFDSTKR